MPQQIGQEARQKRSEARTTRAKHKADRTWLTSPEYRLELAAAQITISITENDGSSLLIKDRIAKVEGWGANCHPSQLLTSAEAANLEQATFVVEAIRMAIEGVESSNE